MENNAPLFRDRHEAGMLLAGKLKPLKLNYPLILAIPRGGVVLGVEVAKALGGELDIITPRKLKHQYDEELAVGAVMHDGLDYINDDVLSTVPVSASYVEEERTREMAESLRRLKEYRRGRAYPEMKSRTVVIVDDGIATGATMIVAARWVKLKGAARVIIAVPVLPIELLEPLKHEADLLVYISAPHSFFGIGQFYQNFEQVEDKEVIKMLNDAWSSA